eukprot:1562976-Pleurochrysis_carterae.AAC.1
MASELHLSSTARMASGCSRQFDAELRPLRRSHARLHALASVEGESACERANERAGGRAQNACPSACVRQKNA